MPLNRRNFLALTAASDLVASRPLARSATRLPHKTERSGPVAIKRSLTDRNLPSGRIPTFPTPIIGGKKACGIRNLSKFSRIQLEADHTAVAAHVADVHKISVL
jgi:hypothetical protein